MDRVPSIYRSVYKLRFTEVLRSERRVLCSSKTIGMVSGS